MLCLTTGIAWSIITLLTGFVTSLIALIAVLVLDGFSTGSVSALHAPLLVDSYPPKGAGAGPVRLPGFRHGRQRHLAAARRRAGWAARPHLARRLPRAGCHLAADDLPCHRAARPRPGTVRHRCAARRAWHERDAEPTSTGQPCSRDEVDTRLLRDRAPAPAHPDDPAAGASATLVARHPAHPVRDVPVLLPRRAVGPRPRRARAFFAGISAAVSIVALVAVRRAAPSERSARTPAGCSSSAAPRSPARSCSSASPALAPTFALMCVLFAAGQCAARRPRARRSPSSFLSIVDARYRPHAAALIGIFIGRCGGIARRRSSSAASTGASASAGADRLARVPGVVGALIIRSARPLVAPTSTG